MFDICFGYIKKWIYKNMKTPTDVYSAINPLFVPCYYLGLSPYKIRCSMQNKRTIHYSHWANIFTLLVVVVNAGSIVWNTQQTSEDNQNFKQKLMYYQEMAAGVSSLCGMLVLCLYSRKLMEIFPNIHGADESMKMLLVWMDHKETYVKILISIFVMISYMFFGMTWLILEWTNVVTPFFFRDNIASDIIKLIIPYFLTIIMELLYCHYLCLLRTRFQLLNNYLRTLIPRQKQTYNGWTTKSSVSTICPSMMENTELAGKITKALDPTFVVDHIAALHIKLIDTAHVINRTFALQQLFKLAITFVSIVSALYFMAIYFSNPETKSLDILFVVWASSNALETVGIVYVTSETCEEANTCPRILHKIRNNSDNESLQDTIEVYSLQMYHNRLVFSVMGLFPLDYSLLYTMAAGITTYLVILIQFNPKDFSPDTNETTSLIQTIV